MAVKLHWFLPTTGDSRSDLSHGDAVGARPGRWREDGQRRADVAYLGQVARAAEQSGFEAVLTPISSWCPDPWVLTAALTQHTERLKFLVAFRPSFLSPTLAAQMAATYQRLSGGRLMLNVVVGGDDAEQRRYGDFLSKDERYAQAGEFLRVLRLAFEGEPADFAGEHLRVEGAFVPEPPAPPPIYLGGSSPAALEVAAEHVDVYLTWGEPPEQVAEKLGRVRAAADRAGRRLRFGIRLHVIARDTSEEAWAEADRLVAGLDPAQIEAAQAKLARSQSEGQRRMVALHGGRTDALEVAPNLWAGVGLVRGGAGTALVGSHEEVADRIAEYHDLGIDEFVLSGYPHLEEAYRVGEGVASELRSRGLLQGATARRALAGTTT
jgi:alkanesulfonate monooxygenase